jgi:hypothetical protein
VLKQTPDGIRAAFSGYLRSPSLFRKQQGTLQHCANEVGVATLVRLDSSTLGDGCLDDDDEVTGSHVQESTMQNVTRSRCHDDNVIMTSMLSGVSCL